jgi:replicative DNA helicase
MREAGQLKAIGGAAAIDELAGWVPAAGHAREYGRIVRENAQLRDLLRKTYEIQASVHTREASASELVERAERAMLEVAHDERRKAVTPIAQALGAELDQIHARAAAKTPLTGTTSGFKDLDELTGGFQPGTLSVLAARPGMGKSALVANIAENAALAGHAVVLFSLEMSEAELSQRFVASLANVHGEKLRRGRVSPSEWPKIVEACSELSATRMFLDDSGDTGILEIRAKARRLHAGSDGPLGKIIGDYLQLMRPDDRVVNRVEQVGQMSRGLKTLAKELEVPVIALSQLSRAVEQRAETRRRTGSGQTPAQPLDPTSSEAPARRPRVRRAAYTIGQAQAEPQAAESARACPPQPGAEAARGCRTPASGTRHAPDVRHPRCAPSRSWCSRVNPSQRSPTSRRYPRELGPACSSGACARRSRCASLLGVQPIRTQRLG